MCSRCLKIPRWLKSIKLLTEDEYCNLVCDIIEILPKSTTIHRVGGSGLSTTLIAPLWARNKFETMNKIDRILWERDTYQGEKYKIILKQLIFC